jgi:hypothetical protein
VASDKLVAIAGIASKFQSSKTGQYLAGLWGRENFTQQFCWRRLDDTAGLPKLPQSVDYQGPSWSWCCWNSPVYFEDRFEYSRSDVATHVWMLDSDIMLASTNRYGAVQNARLFLLCDGLFRLKAVPRRFWNNVRLGRAETEHASVYMDHTSDGLGDLFLMPVMSTLKNTELDQASAPIFPFLSLSNPISSMHGLVLRRVNPESRGEYQRVGCFETYFPKMVEGGDDEPLPDSAYYGTERGLNGSERYKITLI